MLNAIREIFQVRCDAFHLSFNCHTTFVHGIARLPSHYLPNFGFMSTVVRIDAPLPAACPGSEVLGIRISRATSRDLVSASLEAIADRKQFVFACANPHSLAAARHDSGFLAALRSANAVVVDGVGLAIIGRLLGRSFGPRVTGSDYFEAVMGSLNRCGGGTVFFFGSTDTVLARIRSRVAQDYPCVQIVGTCSPPYGRWSDDLDRHFVEQVRAASPDVLWVGMTAPKQEKWVARNAAKLGVPVIASIGAVFDYYAQTIVRAPKWICEMGFEWLFRLVKEPRRLWRRSIVSGPLFLSIMVRETLLGSSSDTASDTQL
ncbi:MAG: WecB/TagA/CpsF family glycosyltransferase [Steroidobacteraceae bacterium]